MAPFNIAQSLREVCQVQNQFFVVPAGKIRPPTRSITQSNAYMRLAARGLQFIKKKNTEAEAVLEGLEAFSQILCPANPPLLAVLSWKNKIGMVLPSLPGVVLLQYKLFGEQSSTWNTIKQITASDFSATKYDNYFHTDVKVRLEDLRVQESQVPIFRFIWRDTNSGREEQGCWFIQINGGISYSGALIKYFSYKNEEAPEILHAFGPVQEKKRSRSSSSSSCSSSDGETSSSDTEETEFKKRRIEDVIAENFILQMLLQSSCHIEASPNTQAPAVTYPLCSQPEQEEDNVFLRTILPYASGYDTLSDQETSSSSDDFPPFCEDESNPSSLPGFLFETNEDLSKFFQSN